MAFPVEQTSATTTGNTPNWGAMNMPSGINAGDLLIAAVACDGPQRVVTFTGGWTVLANDVSDNSVSLAVAYKQAAGGDTLSVSINQFEAGACRVVRISGAEAVATQPPEVGGEATGESATPAVPPVTPTGGAKDYKFIAWCAHSTGLTALTSGPTNYANAGSVAFVNIAGARLAWADRDLNATTDDPDNFTFDVAEGYGSILLAIHPASAAAAAHPAAVMMGV